MHSRIISRKVLLMYLHQIFFLQDIFENKINIEGWEDEISYILEYFFLGKEYDFEYLKSLILSLPQNQSEAFEAISKCLDSFKLRQLDVVDLVILWIGYAEQKVFGTPKNILINEMVELAKRYGDDSSYKFVNGVANKMFSNEEKNDTQTTQGV